ncbi:unnamed protein product, partial [Tetraodon nigroviridis]
LSVCRRGRMSLRLGECQWRAGPSVTVSGRLVMNGPGMHGEDGGERCEASVCWSQSCNFPTCTCKIPPSSPVSSNPSIIYHLSALPRSLSPPPDPRAPSPSLTQTQKTLY